MPSPAHNLTKQGARAHMGPGLISGHQDPTPSKKTGPHSAMTLVNIIVPLAVKKRDYIRVRTLTFTGDLGGTVAAVVNTYQEATRKMRGGTSQGHGHPGPQGRPHRSPRHRQPRRGARGVQGHQGRYGRRSKSTRGHVASFQGNR